MNDVEFTSKCKALVLDYANEHLDVTDGKQITVDDIFIVWQVKALQNSKALLSTTLSDGMYYELTYNGDKDEIYLDAYKKFENRCYKI
ncbi:DUF6275 family protein [Lactiplantibacillus plantarum]|uniref:Phage protein n=1 Tax=Lactiplantibacillus plantarum WJL TaxID=1350466 RepID=A0A837P9H2_LACPN|nr:DUF6275 family protein [Lactiplantibacillus plantarum]ASL37112.1 hypothetical protein CBI37_06490 [Lactiplantibacillus plantarum]ASZ31968.1 hypothetical protein CLC99_01130 [Lactiplantibacillus plantarum]ERO41083.1 hypothetical protein LPLWJ_18670 [Lactiplantibacillus plantarum WJL]KPN44275.1 Phage protein [Lactiplantibacillus plantarum WJL]MDO8173942.1 DUF6275 family protein [Lactiplantibacillus plantarum]